LTEDASDWLAPQRDPAHLGSSEALGPSPSDRLGADYMPASRIYKPSLSQWSRQLGRGSHDSGAFIAVTHECLQRQPEER